MNKNDLIDTIAFPSENSSRQAIRLTDAKEILDDLIEAIIAALKKSEEVRISNIMTIIPVDKKEKVGRNPQTGKAIKIPARKGLKVRFRKTLLESLNN